nr:hypothetical protein [Legionella jordanis]
MLKKTTLAILALGSSAVFAGTMGPVCTPDNVTVPCEMRQWDIGIQALYLKPVFSTHRGYETTASLGFRELEEEWDWGYRLEGSYHFNTGNDITMSWTHFSNEPSSSGYAGATPFLPVLVPFTITQDDRFDQVNLTMGQHVDMGLFKDAHFYAGLQYARIRIDTQYNYLTTIPFVAPDGFVQNRNTDFNGVGPVVGVDYAYNLAYGFSITADAEASLLYGTSRLNNNLVLAPSGLVPLSQYASKKSVVPGLEGKLGLKYSQEFAQGVLNIEGGYQALDYLDALQVTDIVCGCLKNSDFGLFGPYFGVKWVGNV